MAPEYPLDAIRLGVTGIVMVGGVIEDDGSVNAIEVRGQPHVLLSEAAIDALRQWLFPAEQVSAPPRSSVPRFTAAPVREV